MKFLKNLPDRVRDVLLMAPVPLVLLMLSNVTAWIVFAFVAVVGVYEWRKIIYPTREKFYNQNTRVALGLMGAAMLIGLFHIWLGILACVIGAGIVRWQAVYNDRNKLALGQLIIGLVAMAAIGLRSDASIGGGLALLGLVLTITIFSDSAAYFVGKAIGRRKFAPVISPNKTWEGAIGGWVFGIVAAMIYSAWFVPQIANTNVIAQIVLFWALTFAGQLGDLAESMFKRKHGAKDSGKLLRSHGGVLDRFDSFAAISLILFVALWVLA